MCKNLPTGKLNQENNQTCTFRLKGFKASFTKLG